MMLLRCSTTVQRNYPNFDGLITRRRLADFKGIGAFINAETLGATFDPAGQVAAIANPYREFVTLIDTSTLKVIQQFKTSVPSCGMVFDGEKRRAHLLETMLPYE